MFDLQEKDLGVQFKVRVQPRAAKNEISGLIGNAIKIRLTAPPVDGEANEACIKFLAELFSVSKSSIKIIAGQTSRTKTIFIQGLNKIQVQAKML